MGANKNLFMELRESEVNNYTFSKKEAIQKGKDIVSEIYEQGEVDPIEFMSKVVRLNQVIATIESEMRAKLPFEKDNRFGIEITPVNGGDTINYSEDTIYSQLQEDLKQRAELLKMAQKQPIIDAYGNDVPKVSTTPRKSSLTIKF